MKNQTKIKVKEIDDPLLSEEDSENDSQQSPEPSPKFQALKVNDQSHIKFILNVPLYVPAENIDAESSDESDDGTFEEDLFNFNLDDKHSLPYRTFDITNTVKVSKSKTKPNKEIKKQTITHRVGSMSLDDRDELFDQDSLSTDHSKSDTLLKLLVKDGFEDTHKDYISNLAVSIGLNRPHSLSTRKNSSLEKELHRAEEESPVKYEKSAFFWDIPWTDQEGAKTEYNKVKKFYKQLKRKDLEKAKEFLKVNEELERPSPPYQLIREYVKSHEKTKELVQTLRTGDSVIYFSSIDSDTKCFNGIYSSYLKIIAKSKNLPTVMSTGYEFAEEYDGFPLHVGSKLERIIRIVTAETLSGGVYYPEPNFCVLLPNGNDTVPYSFIDKKVPAGNLESPVLLRQILQKPDCILVFSNENPLITSGDRAQKSEIQFSDEFENWRAPNENDLGKLSQIIQSTANPRDWALGVYYNRCFNIKGSTGTFNKYITNLFKGEEIENALSELRKMVHPSEMVDSLHQAVNAVKFVLDKFYKPFEEDKILDDDLNPEILSQFYGLRSYDILTLINILDSEKVYLALNGGYSLYEICRISEVPDKFKAIFSKKAKIICESTEGIFEDITYQDLEELYDQILLDGGSTEDFEELLNDDNGLFSDKCGDLDFDEVIEYFLSILKENQGSLDSQDIAYDQELGKKSVYEITASHFIEKFEKEYGNEDQEDEDQDTEEYQIEAVIYPEGSYEYFQDYILSYRSKFEKLLEGTNFIAASNNLPGHRDKILEKLQFLIDKLRNKLLEFGVNADICTIIENFDCLTLSSSQIKYFQSVKDINIQIHEAQSLENLLTTSLDLFPDPSNHDNKELVGSQSDSDY